ncbi:ATPase family associated with various cellular activities (AAA) [Shimia gijangensis]|uniref:ATPase family associated with various cellular activities (AAA) n=1 Tax=Shimia gijangensis TaxID=1470563 RepID=A0A1M6SXJ9_9RHOB|nr:AAA family ATPase [Shimia gijangensis]SHK49387.1 ATPase family associated with various cellular activities (AAA) [Shimia gijangensis]
MIFQNKYAPQTFNDLIFPDRNTRQRIKEFACNERHGSLIFHGPYGTAKTTMARMVEQMRTSGLEYGSVDFYRAFDMQHETFKRISNTQVLQRRCGVEMPVTIVDEIDQVDKGLQYKFRWEIDMNCDQGCFVFTTNNLHNVDPGLVDRCDVVELPASNTQHWFDRARWILDKEGVTMSDGKLQALLDTCDGSIRDLMRALEDAVLRQPANTPTPPTPQLQVISSK